MKKAVVQNAVVALVLGLSCHTLPAMAQTPAEAPHPVSTWSVHSPDVIIAGRNVYPLAMFTPGAAIVVRRVEALSNSGPVKGRLANGDILPCTVQYTLEISNGVSTVVVPISNTFLNKGTTQTYTDSGPISVPFDGEKRITATLLPPKPGFPPVSCGLEGLNITIQYEALQPSSAAPSESDTDKQ